MDEDQAIQRLQQLTTEEDRQAVATSLALDLMESVVAAQARVLDGQEPDDGEVEAIKRVLLRLHFELEAVERDVLRFLKYESEESRTWQQVADEFGGIYTGRSGAHARWKQLTASNSRVATRELHRGKAAQRKPGQ